MNAANVAPLIEAPFPKEQFNASAGIVDTLLKDKRIIALQRALQG